MLAKAGADIMMPIMVDGAVGTAVDSAYYCFNQVETLYIFLMSTHIWYILVQVYITNC